MTTVLALLIHCSFNSQNCEAIIHGILRCRYLLLTETQTLDDTSSGGSIARFFKREHEATGQCSQQI